MNTPWKQSLSARFPRCSSLGHYSDPLSETDNCKFSTGIIHVLCSSFFFRLLSAPLEDLRKQKRKKRKHMIFPPSLLVTLLKDIAVWETNGRNNEYWNFVFQIISPLSFFLWLTIKCQWPFSCKWGRELIALCYVFESLQSLIFISSQTIEQFGHSVLFQLHFCWDFLNMLWVNWIDKST